jgi:hypothetical protein
MKALFTLYLGFLSWTTAVSGWTVHHATPGKTTTPQAWPWILFEHRHIPVHCSCKCWFSSCSRRVLNTKVRLTNLFHQVLKQYLLHSSCSIFSSVKSCFVRHANLNNYKLLDAALLTFHTVSRPRFTIGLWSKHRYSHSTGRKTDAQVVSVTFPCHPTSKWQKRNLNSNLSLQGLKTITTCYTAPDVYG